mmetsp:Transcript_45479/g.76588  ORF Transcript_45479/g.76588 Transcript_45479/m.76588 type:complete len:415 (-) Transcript_45479:227-1471(-)
MERDGLVAGDRDAVPQALVLLPREIPLPGLAAVLAALGVAAEVGRLRVVVVDGFGDGDPAGPRNVLLQPRRRGGDQVLVLVCEHEVGAFGQVHRQDRRDLAAVDQVQQLKTAAPDETVIEFDGLCIVVGPQSHLRHLGLRPNGQLQVFAAPHMNHQICLVQMRFNGTKRQLQLLGGPRQDPPTGGGAGDARDQRVDVEDRRVAPDVFDGGGLGLDAADRNGTTVHLLLHHHTLGLAHAAIADQPSTWAVLDLQHQRHDALVVGPRVVCDVGVHTAMRGHGPGHGGHHERLVVRIVGLLLFPLELGVCVAVVGDGDGLRQRGIEHVLIEPEHHFVVRQREINLDHLCKNNELQLVVVIQREVDGLLEGLDAGGVEHNVEASGGPGRHHLRTGERLLQLIPNVHGDRDQDVRLEVV